MKLDINLQGVKQVTEMINRFGKEGVQKSAEIVKGVAYTMQETAQKKAPENNGDLRQSIKPEEQDKLTWQLVANAPYSAYMEFGTGTRVDIPVGWEAEASKFKGLKTGTFEDGLKRIKAWCRKQGIDEDLAFWIFMKILKVGLTPRPFMYPAYIEGKKVYKKDMEKAFKDLIRKYNG